MASETRRLLILGIDVEATGGHLTTNAPYAISSMIVDANSMQVVSSFLTLCRPFPNQTWDHDTYSHFLTETTPEWRNNVFRHLFSPTTQTPDMAVEQWYSWLENTLAVIQYSPRTHNLLPLVDTTLFDKSMIGVYLPQRCKGMDYLTGEFNPWFDIRSYYAGLAKVDISSGRYTAKQLFDIILAENPKLCEEFNKHTDSADINVPHDHNPENDVRCIIFEFIKLRKSLNLSL
jgi:hypothetical protein